MHFMYRSKKIIENWWKCASMEVIHKQSIICEDQINKFKNFKPIKKRPMNLIIKWGLLQNPTTIHKFTLQSLSKSAISFFISHGFQ